MNRILITGGSGMVGRNLLESEEASNYDILYPTSKELDLKDFEAVSNYFLKCKPDFIVHAAGKVGGIQANISNPLAYLDDNLIIGRNVIKAAYDQDIYNLINLGSTCMYPRGINNPLSENLILTGELEPTNEGYALAKIAIAKLCQYINAQDKKMNFKTIIPCNLYGRFDKFSPEQSHLLPAIICKIHAAKILSKDTVEIWGDGTVRREFMYAGDLCSAIWKAISEIDTVPNLFNCGLGHDYSVNEYYDEVAKVIGWNGIFIHNLEQPVGMKQKLSDISLQENWGWGPTTSLSQGIKQTYSFYLESLDP